MVTGQFPLGAEIFLSLTVPRAALGLIQPPIQQVAKAATFSWPSTQVKTAWSYISTPSYVLWHDA
jgi:hypothetical protein